MSTLEARENAPLPTNTLPAPLLTVDNLVVEYPGKKFRAKPFRALTDINITIGRGETLGLVGESGSGKTTLGRAVLGLAPVTGGKIMFEGKDISHATRRQRRTLSRDLQVVFQDPYTSLNPALEIGDILAEPLGVQGMEPAAAQKRVKELLDQVGLPSDAIHRLPREFSGGQRQRVAIARALALSPKLIVCDEPVSALDLSTQARVLDLFLQIQKDTGVSYLFVSHDLDVVRHISHRVAVMYHGEIVEQGPADIVTRDPEHPYTQRLLLASPVPDPDRQEQRRADRHRLLEIQRQQKEQAGALA
jgi:ABC-type glutathione transport system ATPase component